jgi:drug/metabolite transporter (DMT)-like permease
MVYWLGLMKGYERGDFTTVYPLARALPILAVAMVDIGRGRDPSAWGWLGIALTAAGCLVMPLQSLRSMRPGDYCNATMFWVLLTAAGTAGYTSVDKIAQELIYEVSPGPFAAARYCAIVVGTAGLLLVPIVAVIVRKQDTARLGRRGWLLVVSAALLVWGTYTLVQWAYQLTEHASYVVAARQFSIVVGVVVAGVLFKEPAQRLRIAGAVIVTVGVVCIGLSK